MKNKIILLLAYFSISIVAYSQPEKYSRAKIWLLNKNTNELTRLGIDVTEGELRKNVWFISEFSQSELNKISAAGFRTDVLIDDLKLKQHHHQPVQKTSVLSCDNNGAPDYPQPQNFSLGSMGGFFTFQELLDILDSMASKFPNLITIKQPISAQTTVEGNQILWVKISDNPNINETEPEVLYTALHHAREPAGLSNLIYYMWYLLENYSTNAELQALVDNTEMYFVPCINPDGYMYNELTDPAGGGFWRKNRLDNLDGTFGVDLNRNYGYQWGYDDDGSSPVTVDETYRGTAAFSESETQNIQTFCTTHDFKLALNYHTYGNLLIYPWGYIPDFYTPDSALFVNYGSLLTRYNGYSFGTANQTVNYIVNGSSDDWMYGEQLIKNKIFAFTPELSTSGFWPADFEIVDICKDNMFSNITMAKLAGKYGSIEDASSRRFANTSGFLKYDFRILGLDTSGTFTVSVIPVSANMISSGAAKTYSNVSPLQLFNDSISYTLSPTILPGDQFTYVLSVDNGLYLTNDTITKTFGSGVIIFADAASNISNWTVTGSTWNTTTEDFTSAPTSFTDSPFSTYNTNTLEIMTLTNSVFITNASKAWLTFNAKWEIENNYDFAQVLISNDNGITWIPLCGYYSEEGTIDQDFGNPVYDGKQLNWVNEEINLDSYIGQSVKIRVKIQSDGFQELDGFYFDDIKIEKIPSPTGLDETGMQSNFISNPMPNPSASETKISYSVNSNPSQLVIMNALGQKIKSIALNDKQGLITIQTKNFAGGLYAYYIQSNQLRISEIKKLVVGK